MINSVVIVGANGFLGSKLCVELAKRNVFVTALVPKGFNYSNIAGIKGIDCLEFNFETLSDLDNNPLIVDSDIICNMAWIGVNAKERNNENTQALNFKYSISVVQFAERNNIRRLLMPGSASQFACGNDIIDGKHRPSPSDLYSAAKVSIYYFCKALCEKKNIELIWPIITSVYGPGRDDNNLLTYVIKSLLIGNVPETTKLEQHWDYIYIDDLIDALILLCEKGRGGVVYPLGSGISRQMREYVEIIRDKINPTLSLGIGALPYKNAVLDNQVMDISALVNDTGFEPKVSFEQGIDNVIDYFIKIK